jgi:hypothetical protein
VAARDLEARETLDRLAGIVRAIGAAVIERMEGMPDGTLGFRVSGEVERSDYTDVMVPQLRKAIEQGRGLRTLYLIDRLEEMEPGALWEDAKAGFDITIRHHSALERTAMVTDQEWLVRAARLMA